MGGGSEREREWLGERISNKMPVFRNISPLASAFDWSFLPPNYILIKYHLLFDASTKNQLLKSGLSFEGGEGIGLQIACRSPHRGCPMSCTPVPLGQVMVFRWGEVYFRDEMGCFVWSGLLNTLLRVPVLRAASRCGSLGSQYAASPCTCCRALRLRGGMNQGLDGCIPVLGLGSWTGKASPKCSFLIHLRYIFTRIGVPWLSVRAPGCPCVPGFALTLCTGRELDHVPAQWGRPGRPSCRWQQTNISHYIFPFSEGYSLSS